MGVCGTNVVRGIRVTKIAVRRRRAWKFVVEISKLQICVLHLNEYGIAIRCIPQHLLLYQRQRPCVYALCAIRSAR